VDARVDATPEFKYLMALTFLSLAVADADAASPMIFGLLQTMTTKKSLNMSCNEDAIIVIAAVDLKRGPRCPWYS
jgi:hypothetical protein